MTANSTEFSSRRKFLQFLAGSPLLAATGGTGLTLGALSRALAAEAGAAATTLPASAADAINVFDLEAAARASLPLAHFGYLATGVEGELTLRANREGFTRLQIRPRRLVDTSKLDTSVKIFGTTWPTPIGLSPAASQKAFHPDGEVAVARAARTRNHLQLLSTFSTAGIEEINTARGTPVWYQLYPTPDWNITRALVRRAEDAGCPVLALTLDNPISFGRDTLERARRLDPRDCTACHVPGPQGYLRRKSMFDGLDVSKLPGILTDHLTWDFVRRLREITSMKIVLKAIVTADDAALALKYGVDGIIVSNHGGRGEESNRSTIESLPEVVGAVGGRIPVLIDSGFRRGTDIFKALALGATAVCVGRPYLWGLSAYGQPGVERCLEILTMELENIMRFMGTPSIKHITPDLVQRG